MSDQIAVVGTDARAEVLKPGFWVLGIVLGVFMFFPGFIFGGIVGGVIGGIGPRLTVVGGIGYVYRNTRYTFYDDRVEVDSPVGTEAVPYDEVAFALRTSDERDAEYDTADFMLVRADEDPLTLSNALTPDAVEQILEKQLPTAAEWLDGREEQHTALDALVRRRRKHEREHEGVEAMVLHTGLLEEWMDVDSGKVPVWTLHTLDEIDEVDDLSDLDAEDLKEEFGDDDGDGEEGESEGGDVGGGGE